MAFARIAMNHCVNGQKIAILPVILEYIPGNVLASYYTFGPNLGLVVMHDPYITFKLQDPFGDRVKVIVIYCFWMI